MQASFGASSAAFGVSFGCSAAGCSTAGCSGAGCSATGCSGVGFSCAIIGRTNQAAAKNRHNKEILIKKASQKMCFDSKINITFLDKF